MTAMRGTYHIGRRGPRLLPVVVACALIGATVLAFVVLRPITDGTIIDSYDRHPLAQVPVALGNERVRTNQHGRFVLTPKRVPETLRVEAPAGYVCPPLEVSPGASRRLEVACRPSTLAGTLRRRPSGEPIAGITLVATNAAGERSTEATTAADGTYLLRNVPDEARLVLSGAGFAIKELPIGATSVLDLDLRPDIVAGVVRDQAGRPLPGATIGVPGLAVRTGPDGGFVLNGVPDGALIAAQAPGYRASRIDPGDSTRVELTLEPLIVRGIYLTTAAAASDAQFKALVALADRTEINTVVIDFKDEDGHLHTPSDNPLAAGAVQLDYDLQARLATLRQHNIRTAARIVCMLDPLLAASRPDLAVRDSKTGGAWKDGGGVAWVSAMRPEVWRYLTDLALEAADAGFDEVQFDYARFPSSGDLDAADFGVPDNSTNRTGAIVSFLTLAHTALSERGVALGVDIFGIALWDRGDNGIGQRLEPLAAAVDYLCPMIYPSHFAPGSLGFDVPNDHPYDVVRDTLANGAARVPGAKIVFRPWLQDFSVGRAAPYGPKEVRAQIQATDDFGATGWLLWNPASVFTEPALQPRGR